MATAIRRLKYEDRSEFAARLVRAVHCPVCPSALEGATLVPVPMHPSRLVERGYNQAGLLAGALAKRWQLPVSYRLLRRQQLAARQVGLGRLEREANVRGAFVANAKGYRGGAVVLVDDVVTTGATISACQTALSDKGISVSGIVALARAEEGQAQAVAASPVLPIFGLGELHSS
jgi:ComF family protein